MIQVYLTRAELAEAAFVAAARDGTHATDGTVVGRAAAHALGAEGELAFAKAFSLEWSGRLFTAAGLDRHRRAALRDVGVWYEVRTTAHPAGRLVAHPADPDDCPAVLVRADRRPLFTVCGWAWGREVKRPAHWQDVGHRMPCYYLPNRLLRPPESLRALLLARAAAP